MIEPVQNISTFVDGDSNCTAFDKTTGELCGETESLKIIDEFQKLYETRIENVDRELENEFDQVCVSSSIPINLNKLAYSYPFNGFRLFANLFHRLIMYNDYILCVVEFNVINKIISNINMESVTHIFLFA